MTELPTTFGKYFLTEKLATGGMAEIYLAKLVGPGGFEKQLVIKQIHPKLTGQRHFVDLFVTEAKTLVTLTHGNIVPVYELGVIDDTYFIAMEYIDGPTLYRLTEALVRREARMEPAVAAWITARVVEGLDYAHRKGEGVIHRDLSPRNVMLSRDGEVKLVDFGIAVTLGAADDGEAVQSAPTGSFPYMSPEQVRREALSGQTDLFSAGVLMWEMLVGERLFARNDPDATLAAVTDGAIPRPSSVRPEIPAKLDDVVMRALERDRDARWASASEMLDQLQRYLYSLDETPGPREVAALVARYCPPETRRQPTHAEPLPGPTGKTEITPPPAGPHTAVIPREAPAPRGKPARARTETFATNVELEHILDRAVPTRAALAPESESEAHDKPIGDGDAGDAPVTQVAQSTSQRALPRAARTDDTGAGDPVRDHDRPRLAAVPVPGRTAPSGGMLVLAAIGTLVLGGFAVWMFMKARGSGPGPSDAAVIVDTDPSALAADAMPAPDADAPTPDAPPDARPPLDARGPTDLPRDAAVRIRPDAPVVASPIDAPPRPVGNGTLKIGADPWGEVVVDGAKRGRTPLELTLSAGRHSVEIIFSPEGEQPRSKKQAVELVDGETKHVDADFTKP